MDYHTGESNLKYFTIISSLLLWSAQQGSGSSNSAFYPSKSYNHLFVISFFSCLLHRSVLDREIH